MLWQVDPHSRFGLGDQIVAAVRRAVIDGDLAAGERLPPAAELAAAIGVNANTVLAAYRRLRDERVLEFRRGRGVTVIAAGTRHHAVGEAVRHLVDTGLAHGFSVHELARMVERA